MEVYCPPNPDLEHLYIPPFDGDFLSQFPPLPPPFDEDDITNDPPDKKSPPPTPPGEVDAAEAFPVRREKKDRTRKNSEVPQSPPSPPTNERKAGRNRPKTTGLPFRNVPKRGEGKKITPSAHKDLYPWSPEEDEALTKATHTYGLNWDLACEVLLSNPSLPSRKFTRTPTACAERYRTVLQPRAAGETEKEKKSPPSSPLMSPPQAQQAHFGILDVIRSMVNQKKDIPGMIGSAAQTDQSVPPHASHLQAAMHAGIAKPLTPREVIALLSQRVTLTMPQKDIPVLTKLALKLDPKMSGFGQGAGVMGATMANAIAAANQGTQQAVPTAQTGIQPNTVIAGQTIAPNNPSTATTFTVPTPGVVASGIPAANSIILNPNGSNVQTSRKLAQINQSMLPSAPNVTVLPRANSSGSVPTVNAAPAVVVAIPNNTANVPVLPRATSTGTINPNSLTVAPAAVNMISPSAVLPPTPAPPPAAASKPSPSKRSKKNAENGTTTKRQRTKNNAAPPPPAVAEQSQPTPSQPQPAQPIPQVAPPTQPQSIITHPQQPQQTQGPALQIHPLQQIQHQLQQQHMQHQPQHMSLQPQQGQLPQQVIQPQVVTPHVVGGQPQHLLPQSQPMHPQYAQPQPGQQTQSNATGAQYTTPQSYAPAYTTAPTYATPTSYTTPTTGITYATTYTTPTYSTPSAPNTYTTPNTAPGTFTTPSYPSATPATTYAAVPATSPVTYAPTASPATYAAPTAARPFTTANAGSTFTGSPATYMATGAPGASFTTPATTAYTTPTVGYSPQGMVIGVPQPTMIGTIPPNAIKPRAAQLNTATRPGAPQPPAAPGQNYEHSNM